MLILKNVRAFCKYVKKKKKKFKCIQVTLGHEVLICAYESNIIHI